MGSTFCWSCACHHRRGASVKDTLYAEISNVASSIGGVLLGVVLIIIFPDVSTALLEKIQKEKIGLKEEMVRLKKDLKNARKYISELETKEGVTNLALDKNQKEIDKYKQDIKKFEEDKTNLTTKIKDLESINEKLNTLVKGYESLIKASQKQEGSGGSSGQEAPRQ